MTYQISIFLENKLGHLEKVTAVLKAAQINIRSIHLNHTANGWGILNLVVSSPERAQHVLNDHGIAAALREIVVLQMIDEPGGLNGLLKDIATAGVNLTNANGISIKQGDSAFLVIDIQDTPDAKVNLENAGLEIVADDQVYGR